MNQKLKSKLWTLWSYTLSIVIIQWLITSHSDNWRVVILAVLLAILSLVHVFRLLDIEMQFPFSRKWYYIFLIALTIVFLIFLIKYL